LFVNQTIPFNVLHDEQKCIVSTLEVIDALAKLLIAKGIITDESSKPS
jgi:hypothetical protein